MAIYQNGVMVGISGSQLEAFRQRMERDFQSKRITWNGESNVLVTTAMNQLLELASGKANIVITDFLPDPTTPNTQYWLTTYDGQTIEEGRYIVMTDALNTATLIGTSTADLSAYYTKTETQELLDEKQDILQSGVNIKTVNYQSLLGSGNIVVSGGGGANFQVTTLPDPDEYQNGRVVQFIGEEGTYKFGAWYACKPILMDLYGWTSSSTGKYAWTSSPTPKCGEDYPPLPSPALRDGDPIYGSQVAGKYHISTYVGPTYYYLDLPNRIRDTLATWYSRTPSADVQNAIMGYEWVRLLSKTGDYINNGNGLGEDDDYFVNKIELDETKQDKLFDGPDIAYLDDNLGLTHFEVADKTAHQIRGLSVWNYIKSKFTKDTLTSVSDTSKIGSVDSSKTNVVQEMTAKTLFDYMWKKIYPVGSIYTTTDKSFNPGTSFGGTWVHIGVDRVLWGVATSVDGGSTLDEQLPDIRGHIDWSAGGQAKTEINSGTGAFSLTNKNLGAAYPTGTGASNSARGFDFRASYYKSVYKLDASVRPNAYTVHFWRRTA